VARSTGPPAHSVSRTTEWGSFGGWDQPRPPIGLPVAAPDAVATIDSVGADLARVQHELDSFRLHSEATPDSLADRTLSDDQHGIAYYHDPRYQVSDSARQAYRNKHPITPEDRQWLINIREDWPDAARLTDEELLAVGRIYHYRGPIDQLRVEIW